MKHLLNNKGNILFVTVIYFTVLLLGFALITLVSVNTQEHRKQTELLYECYTIEANSGVIANEVLKLLGSSESTMQYTPLLTTEDMQRRLQATLKNIFVDSVNQWKYKLQLPDELMCSKSDYTISLSNYEIVADAAINPKGMSTIPIQDIGVTIKWKHYTYSVLLKDLYLSYYFSNNQVHCKFDCSKAYLAGGHMR